MSEFGLDLEYAGKVRSFTEKEALELAKLLLTQYGYVPVKSSRIKRVHAQISLDPFIYDQYKGEQDWKEYNLKNLSYSIGAELYKNGLLEIIEEKPVRHTFGYNGLESNPRYTIRATATIIQPKEKE